MPPEFFSPSETAYPPMAGGIDPSDPETWRRRLTPELRKHFENMGEEIVQFDVTNRRFGLAKKHFAALYWLREKRKDEGRRGRLILKVAIATFVVAVIGTVATILQFL